MASIVKRANRYYVVYMYKNQQGKDKQKWESFRTKREAQERVQEIEFKKIHGTFVVPTCTTMKELLDQYVEIYGKEKWSISTFNSRQVTISHYILPYLGKMKISQVTTLVLENYYQHLLTVEEYSNTKAKHHELLTASAVVKIHQLLRSCFTQAVKWGLIERNPAIYATVPKWQYKKRAIWTPEILAKALSLCEDEQLKLALNLAFACSLRMGEMLGLTWDCVDISREAMAEERCYVYINKQLQRVEKDAMEALEGKDVIQTFPLVRSTNTTVLVLKTPKTESSIRKVFLPKTVAQMLIDRKKEQENLKEMLGSEYTDYNLVFTSSFGTPIEANKIRASLNKLIKENDLPPIVFHGIRHSSITYKLKLNGGDIKAVQGDSGHAQGTMVTEVYSHIVDDDRRLNAELMEEDFYSGKGKKKGTAGSGADNNPDMTKLLKMLEKPEVVALLKVLANNQ